MENDQEQVHFQGYDWLNIWTVAIITLATIFLQVLLPIEPVWKIFVIGIAVAVSLCLFPIEVYCTDQEWEDRHSFGGWWDE